MTNLEIAELLRSIAAAYELRDQNKNKFKIIAYQRAADAVEHASSELKDLWDEGKLSEIAGIGPSTASHLDEIFRTGKSKHFEEVMKGLDPAIFELMKVPGIGVKTAYKLVSQLKIKSLSQLGKAAKDGKIAQLEGFGQQSQADILNAIAETEGRTKRLLLPYAEEIAKNIIEWLLTEKSVKRADPLGSVRRKASTVGDIDISASSLNPVSTIDHFTKYPKTQRVLEKGTRTASIIVPGNVHVDLMVESPDGYGSLLQHFTGSKHHNIALRELALKKGYSLSDYGVKKLKDKSAKLIKFETEKNLYAFLGLEMIPPELREDTGEIETALRQAQGKPGGLPKLVGLKDIKGDLQIHSDFDIETSHDVGQHSMEDIIKKGNGLDYEYLAFTEHNPSRSKHKDQEIVEILKRKREKVDKLNYSIKNVKDGSIKKVFNSLEIDIMPDGKLPVPQKGLDSLDFALVSIHGSFRLDRDIMTKRVLDGLAFPKVKIFAHPTARKINEREGIELDWPKIFNFCKNNNKWIEINADPMRLDLPDNLVREAVKNEVLLTIGTDAHHIDGMNNMSFGVSVARRGWAESKNIVNCRSLSEFEKIIS